MSRDHRYSFGSPKSVISPPCTMKSMSPRLLIMSSASDISSSDPWVSVMNANLNGLFSPEFSSCAIALVFMSLSP